MKRFAAIFLSFLSVLVLSGCINQPLGDLYALPKQAEDYYNLQQAIDAVMKDASYAAPTTGENRQAVQLRDLDGDGKNEAVLFSRTEGDHPLKIHIFHRDGKLFSQIACLEGDGTGFDCVQYVQIDGLGGPELLVGRRLSDEVPQTLTVYRVSQTDATELLSANYSEFSIVDLTQSGNSELLLFHMETQERNGVVDLYRWKQDALVCDGHSALSGSTEHIRRILTGNLAGNKPAVFVTSELEEDGYLTDVFTLQDQKLVNLVEHMGGTQGSFTIEDAVFPVDIDSDSEVELPIILRQTGANLRLLQWNSLSLGGKETAKLLTCQNDAERWYISLLRRWKGRLNVEEQTFADTGRATVFSLSGAGELFTVYSLTGENRDAMASLDGRFPIGSRGEVIFAASIGKEGLSENLVPSDLQAWFRLIPDPSNNE